MTDDDRDYEPFETNDPPICIDCNDQDEQVWDEYLWEWRCRRCASPDEEIPTDYEEVEQ
jgi:hypothetical protein